MKFVDYFWKALHPKIFVEDAKKMATLTILLDEHHKIKEILV